MKKLKNGFSLIEMVVVTAMLITLATTLAGKLNESLAKSKDAKAVAVLGAARTAGNVAVTDRMVKNEGGPLTITFEDITSRLDTRTNELIQDTTGKIPVGGIENDGIFKYGGTVVLNDGTQNLTTGATSITVTDDFHLILTTGLTGTKEDKSTAGKLWVLY
ncbi:MULTISPECIES: type II secretion system protein [Psychrilyobacter]|uniref:Type II secretion system protein n=1 Tax=Psychrilyobacter piezotolerans TaxID=2293438 RepID=A0ABX9KFX6_9FUSO|nr:MULTISPECIES: type II secretion system protein [Psychrilyobacter]MCS5422173.1 type II secretion system GspH family protein [Psychrilyobacter sp. S5]NDI78504.1 type II secretion system protein [Psychrilyobacter piezotolerans]RDE60485.1 type II secretion system protein [Psychrilyobacter sp. S5]REI40515.1 type II secretion system protein [Psychrilyobacter piezotolerans]